jgi:O-acetyl-ADP-ribose deacetylase (regulator of RNase III)
MKENPKEMPIFAEKKGDAIDLFFDSPGNAIFIHGANCRKVMGAGIALQVRERIAPLYFLDQYDTRADNQRFGSYSAVTLAQSEKGIKLGVNLYTQLDPGPNFDLYALTNSLRALTSSFDKKMRSSFTIYLPQIGCGIGGAKWADVMPVLMKELADFNVMAVEFEPKKEK